MLRNLRFRSKLVLIIAVPLIALIVFAAIGIGGRLSVLDSTQRYGELVEPDAALDRLSAALEHESVVSGWYVSSDATEATAELLAARERTDAAIAEVRESVPSFEAAGISFETMGLIETFANQLHDVDTIRTEVDDLAATPTGVEEFYFNHDDRALGVLASVAHDLDDPDVAGGLFNVLDLWRARQASARQNGIVINALAAGNVSSENLAEFEAQAKTERTYMSTFLTDAPADQIRAFGNVARGYEPGRETAEASRGRALLAALPEVRMSPTQWYEGTSVRADAFTEGAGAAQDVVTDDARARENDARAAVLAYSGAALLVLAFALVAAWAVARATTRPLRTLTHAARDMSEHQLPQLVNSLRSGGEPTVEGLRPVSVSSRDEIGDLGRAFNAVQSVTVEVANEQAALLRRGISDLYVNLARRNQGLLDRQIELIDRLESEEKDPDGLEALFRLDHLATRMRRNAESLLVLADADQSRVWREGLPLLDVVRGAAAEIPDFDRVAIDLDQRLMVKANVAADLTHLMAELLENATEFSPPTTLVTVTGSWSDDTTFVVTVTDEGIGMTADRIADANALLRDPPAAGLALSRALGLFVVGHLATRHGVHVELHSDGEHGVAALVALPAGTTLVSPLDAELATRWVDSEPVGNGPVGNGPVAPLEVEAEPVEGWGAEPVTSPLDPAPPVANDAPLPVRRAPNGHPDPAPSRSAQDWPRYPIQEGGPVRPDGAEHPLATRVPGQNLLHLPIRRDGVVEVSEERAATAEPALSRPEQVRKLLAEHRRGIERADTVVDGRTLPPVPEDET